jgi:SAM-dependent methyltransferase
MTTDAGNSRADASWVESMPEVYDRCLGPAVFAPLAGDLATRAQMYAGGSTRVLELAAGTGILTAGLVEALPDAEITATDLNPAMVTYAAALVPGATWRVADAMDLGQEDGWADDSFDLVACQCGVMFFPDKVTAYREVRRVLAPGGMFLFNVWDTVDTHDVEAALTASLGEVFPEDTPDFVARVPHGYADPDRIRADVQAAGLQFKGQVRNVLVGRSPSAATLAEGYCLGTPLRFELQERGDLADLVPQVAAAMTRRLGEGPVEGRLAAYVIRAHKPG